jgi:LPXTG-site transpeptidase (sortase) family protein
MIHLVPITGRICVFALVILSLQTPNTYADDFPIDTPVELAGENGTPPVRISIPSIGLDTDVVPVSTDPDGAMSAPGDPDTVAWYSLGPGLGIGGNIVLAGHVDWGGRLRAFGLLNRLSEGDTVTVWSSAGGSEDYIVESTDWVEAEGAAVDEIFGLRDSPSMTLITCGGTFDPLAHQYLHRLIVRATRAAPD